MLEEPENAPVKVVAEARPVAGLAGAVRPAVSLWWRDAVLTLSLANLWFIRAWFGLLFDLDFGYLNQIPVTPKILLVLAGNILLLAAVLFLAARWVRRRQSRWLTLAGQAGFVASLAVPLNFIRTNYLGATGHKLTALAHNPLLVGLAVLAGLAVWRWRRVIPRFVAALVMMLSPLTAFTFGKTLLVLLGVVPIRQHQAPAALAPLLPEPATRARVVWVLFDEMDQRVTFDDRPAGVRLPELDRFRAESFHAADAHPPAGSTVYSVPALTLGQPVEEAVLAGPSNLRLVWGDPPQTGDWGTLPTVFSRARALGCNVGVVGWYHPYDRLFPTALSYCEWFPTFEMARGHTVPEIMANQFCSMFSPVQQRRVHLGIYRRSLGPALRLAADTNFGLAFLHLSVPHRPPIYRPETGQFSLWLYTTVRGYLGNLALADRTLGQLREAMTHTDAWQGSWVLISSDHWWREAVALDGTLDTRVPFLLKAPGAPVPATYGKPFDTRLSCELILAILGGQITRGEDVAPWMDAHLVPPPATYKQVPEP
jgi:hypothetical protein